MVLTGSQGLLDGVGNAVWPMVLPMVPAFGGILVILFAVRFIVRSMSHCMASVDAVPVYTHWSDRDDYWAEVEAERDGFGLDDDGSFDGDGYWENRPSANNHASFDSDDE